MRAINIAKFLIKQRIIGFPVPNEPHFEGPGTDYFLRRLSECSSYLEYGCGGSTVAAANLKRPFISVESDPYYLASVKKKIEEKDYDGEFFYADIGMTLEWGTPAFTSPTLDRVRRWKIILLDHGTPLSRL